MGIFRDIGTPGLIVIILGALLIFGPKRLPELGEAVGKMSDITDENDTKKNDDKEKQ